MASDVSVDVEISVDAIIWMEIPELFRQIGLAAITHSGTLNIGNYSLTCFRHADGRTLVDAQDVIEILKMCEAQAEFEKLYEEKTK